MICHWRGCGAEVPLSEAYPNARPNAASVGSRLELSHDLPDGSVCPMSLQRPENLAHVRAVTGAPNRAPATAYRRAGSDAGRSQPLGNRGAGAGWDYDREMTS